MNAPSAAAPPTTEPPDDPARWLEGNKSYLSAMVALVAARLRRHAAGASGGDAEMRAAEDAVRRAAAALPAESALDRLSAAFGLSPFDRELLVLCAGPELDGSFAGLCGEVQGDPRRGYPTFGLALAALPDPHWSALSPAGALRRWRLVELGHSEGLTTAPLRIDERVLHHLTGVDYLDERLQALVAHVHPEGHLPPSHDGISHRIAHLWSDAEEGSVPPLVQLYGPDRASAAAVAAHACGLLGFQLHMLHAPDLPAIPADREALARLWERESVLGRTGLLVELEDLDGPDHQQSVRAVRSFLDDLGGIVMLVSREPAPLGRRPSVRIHVPPPTQDERRGLWHSALGPAGAHLDGWLDRVVAQFDLGLRSMRAAGAQLIGHAEPEVADEDAEDRGRALWDACREQARTRLDDLAQRIVPSAGWDDLVLPAPQAAALREIVAQVRHRTRVYETWGFASKSGRGLGISALFAGPSGTGKTMAAEVLANELWLDLYRIDLSQVVSKYIGETEKNLRRVFDAAEEGGAVLLFDEADALFGKRSEVKDSHDRYANIEVSYLLQRMESYRGLAILTTNMKSALDQAFLRRLRFVVHFPFPQPAERAEIWRRIFPPSTPVEGLDAGRLARLNVAGGNIRNIAMSAAFLAADEGAPVRMEHLLKAARTEYGKLEKPLTDAEVRGWT